MQRTIYFNEDNHHFYGAHPPEDMSVEGIQLLVDTYVEMNPITNPILQAPTGITENNFITDAKD